MIMKPNVYIVEDDDSVRNSLVRLIGVAGHMARGFESGSAFLEGDYCDSAGCLLLDFSLPDMSGLQVQEALNARNSEMPVIFMSGYGDIPLTVQAMRHGAVDFLTKPVGDKALFDAVETALTMEANRRGLRLVADEVRTRLETLTPRERDVLDGVLVGRLNKQIARELGISEKTVKVHRGRLMAKMRVRHVAQLAQLATQIGYEPVDARVTPAPAVVAVPAWRTRGRQYEVETPQAIPLSR
jgi:FixJ family two-component response regulator